MTKLLLSAAALALVAGTASAASISGTVQSYDAQHRVIRFDDGKAVSLPITVAVPANLAAGSTANVILKADSNEPQIVLSR